MKKIKLLLVLIVMSIFISACSSSNEKKESAKIESGYEVEHVHGLAYTKDNTIYMASHEGLLKTNNQGKSWSFAGNDDLDLMGFHTLSDGTMLTSGHPGPNSDLPDPLGLMESKDNGKHWESKALLGEVDFHVLTSNQNNPNLLFGVIQMETGKYKTGIYKSMDKGETWTKLDSTGLPKDLHGIYSLLSLPDDENVLLAGTNQGVLRSEDGGETWKTTDKTRLITALSAIPGSSNLISYSVSEGDTGVKISKDNGATWENIGLDLGKDAVSYFAIHPENTNKMAVVTFENNLLISEDGGENWETLMEKGKLKN